MDSRDQVRVYSWQQEHSHMYPLVQDQYSIVQNSTVKFSTVMYDKLLELF